VSNKKALVTGGTRGIGAAIAKELSKTFDKIVITGTKEEKGESKGLELKKVNFLNDRELAEFLDFVKKSNFDVIINNAGINEISEFEEIEREIFDKILHVNLRVPFLVCQSGIPYMKKNNWGRIVNITSIFSRVSKEYRAAYSASKFGLDGLTLALSHELSSHGILANCVGPGVIETELTEKVLGDTGKKLMIEKIPQRRLGKVEEVASLVAWLSSTQNSYISGQNIMIDGGYSRA